MAAEERPRFVVLVWMHDHWGVTFSTDDVVEASTIADKASKKVFAMVVDTEREPF